MVSAQLRIYFLPLSNSQLRTDMDGANAGLENAAAALLEHIQVGFCSAKAIVNRFFKNSQGCLLSTKWTHCHFCWLAKVSG
jgi:hypothetical protein